MVANLDYVAEYDKLKTKVLKYIIYKKRTENEIKQKFSSVIDEEILELVNLRTKYKKDKNFEEADKVRDKLLSLGYKVLDTREGVKVERI